MAGVAPFLKGASEGGGNWASHTLSSEPASAQHTRGRHYSPTLLQYYYCCEQKQLPSSLLPAGRPAWRRWPVYTAHAPALPPLGAHLPPRAKGRTTPRLA